MMTQRQNAEPSIGAAVVFAQSLTAPGLHIVVMRKDVTVAMLAEAHRPMMVMPAVGGRPYANFGVANHPKRWMRDAALSRAIKADDTYHLWFLTPRDLAKAGRTADGDVALEQDLAIFCTQQIVENADTVAIAHSANAFDVRKHRELRLGFYRG